MQTARSTGRGVVAHASTAEGMRRAVLAGVEPSSTATAAPTFSQEELALIGANRPLHGPRRGGPRQHRR
ncbi:hypothetical protein, partial [Hymenobacter coccineus]|uniref:hypothetical protein n=1 Tax=Hymenobacter coccineus TaxID=1908235 RepID=UPI0018752ABA